MHVGEVVWGVAAQGKFSCDKVGAESSNRLVVFCQMAGNHISESSLSLI